MSRPDSTAIKFVKPAEHTVIPLCCPTCGSTDVKPYQALARDESNADHVDECVVAAAHFMCGGDRCEARLTIRVENHAVSLRWTERQ